SCGSWPSSSCSRRPRWIWTRPSFSATSRSPGAATTPWTVTHCRGTPRSGGPRCSSTPTTVERPEMTGDDARRAVEALVMVAEEPVEAQLLAQLIEIPVTRVEQICAELAAEYTSANRGFELVRVAGGYQYRSHPDQAPYIERFVLHGRSARLS